MLKNNGELLNNLGNFINRQVESEVGEHHCEGHCCIHLIHHLFRQFHFPMTTLKAIYNNNYLHNDITDDGIQQL